MIKVVLFDLWDTLLFSDPEKSEKSESQIVEFLRSCKPDVKLDGYHMLRRKHHHDITTGKISNVEANRLILMDLGIDKNNLQELNRMTHDSLIKNMRIYEGVREVLSGLKEEGLKLGLVTNCGGGTMDFVKKFGLDSFFDSYGFSNEVGVRKPDAKIYMKVVNELGLKPTEGVFVSDEIYEDLVGAKKLGMKTIHLKRKRRWGIFDVDPDKRVVEPDASVSKFIDVLNIIRGWMK